MANSSAMGATMRAAVLEEYNSAFRLMDVARPKVAAGQVLVRIEASGVNPLDTKIRTGNGGHAEQPLPAVLGMDLAGVVVHGWRWVRCDLRHGGWSDTG